MTEYTFVTEDEEEARRYFKSLSLCSALWDIKQLLRGKYRYPDERIFRPLSTIEDCAEFYEEEIEKIYTAFDKILDENGINLEDLYS
jgi:hypothetical protein